MTGAVIRQNEKALERQDNLDLMQSEIVELILDDDNKRVTGVVTHTGRIFKCKTVILTQEIF